MIQPGMSLEQLRCLLSDISAELRRRMSAVADVAPIDPSEHEAAIYENAAHWVTHAGLALSNHQWAEAQNFLSMAAGQLSEVSNVPNP